MIIFGVNLDADEQVVQVVRRDPFVFYVRLAFIVILIFAPLVLLLFVGDVLETFFPTDGAIVGAFLYTLWLLGVWMLFFFRWTDYYLDVWIITTKRIFDIDQRGLFNRSISVFLLENIQDINVEIKGIVATLLKFGNVHIHTAGERQNMVIRDASDPMNVKELVGTLHHDAVTRNGPGV